MNPATVAILSTAMVAISAAAQDQSVVLNEELQRKLAELKVPERHTAITGFKQMSDLDAKGNFGRIKTTEVDVELAPITSNLMSGRSTFSGPDSKGVGQSISLCGLKALLSANAVDVSQATTTAVPIGKIFVPFGMAFDSKQNIGYVAQSIDFDTPDVCNPTLGAKFQLTVKGQRSFKRSGLFGTDNQFAMSETLKCEGAASYEASASVGLPVDGDALIVNCSIEEAVGKNSRLTTNKYAFSKELGLYFSVESKSEYQMTKNRFSEIRKRLAIN